jgi:hypothetical protein
MATKEQTTLLKDRDNLIASWESIKGEDQSSIAKRAGRVRSINLCQLHLTMSGFAFDDKTPRWTPPHKTARPGGTSVEQLVLDIQRYGQVADDVNADEQDRSTADSVRQQRIRTLKGRGLDAQGQPLKDDDDASDDA